MFTGLVQALGKITQLESDQLAIALVRSATVIMTNIEIGDSIAVDGICLTVEKINRDGFTATASPETLGRTTLGQRTGAADLVNLESSLRVGSKIGGHFVTGHIDGVATLIESVPTAQAWEMRFGIARGFETQWKQNIVPYLVDKGSITINGVSLTIVQSDSNNCWFKVAVIPHTYAETNLSSLKAGDLVNVEADILGKYVARLVGRYSGHNSTEESISLDFLAENGYV